MQFVSVLRRRLLGAAVALTTAAVLAPLRTLAAVPAAPDRRASLSADWEDVLLLEALRSLRLSPAQLRELLSLATTAEARLTRLREEEEKTFASLEPIVQRNRDALVAGQPGLVREEVRVLEHEHTLQQRRAEVEREIAASALQRLKRLLSVEQQLQVYRLVADVDVLPLRVRIPVHPALEDPNAGFQASSWRSPDIAARESVAQSLRSAARMRQKRAALAKMTPEQVAAYQRGTAQLAAWLNANRIQFDGAGPIPVPTLPVNPTAGEPSEEELRLALIFLVHRMFFSPRLGPVLRERLSVLEANR